MSDVFVLPSIGGEGLPNVVLEAMACGKPVIATAVGGTPEAVLDGENGYVVPPKDVAALGAALRNILQQNNKIVQFGKNSRKRAEDAFSLGKQIYQFEMFYQNMFAEKAFRAAA